MDVLKVRGLFRGVPPNMDERSKTNLQRTRKQMCLKTLDMKLSHEEKLKRFNELVRQLGHRSNCNLHGRKTKSDQSISNGQHVNEDLFMTELLLDDTKQIFLNDNDATSEEYVF